MHKRKEPFERIPLSEVPADREPDASEPRTSADNVQKRAARPKRSIKAEVDDVRRAGAGSRTSVIALADDVDAWLRQIYALSTTVNLTRTSVLNSSGTGVMSRTRFVAEVNGCQPDSTVNRDGGRIQHFLRAIKLIRPTILMRG